MSMCDYCGEDEGTEKIMNPNLDMGEDIDWKANDSWWTVCKDCKEVIPLQRMSSIPDAKIQEYCQDRLSEIAKRTKKPILNACIYKKEDGTYDTASMEFKEV